MSHLIKQLETIGQNAAKRNEALDDNLAMQLKKANKTDMKAAFFVPDEWITKEN